MAFLTEALIELLLSVGLTKLEILVYEDGNVSGALLIIYNFSWRIFDNYPTPPLIKLPAFCRPFEIESLNLSIEFCLFKVYDSSNTEFSVWSSAS